MRCMNCGWDNPPWVAGCARCGAWLSPAAAPGPAPYAGPQAAPQQGFYPPTMPQQLLDRRRPARMETILGVTLWRVLIVTFGLIGLCAALNKSSDSASALTALSQQTSLLVAIVYGLLALYPFTTRMRFHEPRSPWLRGATTVTLLLVSMVYFTMLDGNVNETWSLFEHLLTPIIIAIDYVAVGRNQCNARWWMPLSWVAFPLSYLIYYNAADLDLYNRSFRFDSSDFAGNFFLAITIVLVTGYLLWLVGVVKTAIANGTPAGPGVSQGYQPQQAFGPPGQQY